MTKLVGRAYAELTCECFGLSLAGVADIDYRVALLLAVRVLCECTP